MSKKPVFLLSGGRRSRRIGAEPLLQTIFRESGIESPSIAYVGAASGDDKNFFSFVTSAFREAGAGVIKHAVIAPAGADIDKAKTILGSSDSIFISGGDVEAGMEVLRAKGMIDFLSGLYERGVLFFGLSAGSIMLASEWVRWPDPNDEASAELFPCLGFAPVICDTHDEESGWEELQAALALEKPGTHGYGIATGTGIKVSMNGTVEALGGSVFQYIRQSSTVKRIEDMRPL